MSLTNHNAATNLSMRCDSSVGICNPRRTGDNTPIIQSVFLRLSFLAQRNFALCNSIMTVLFERLRSVAPVRDIANSFNTVTRLFAKSCDSFTNPRTGQRMKIQIQTTGEFRQKFNTQ